MHFNCKKYAPLFLVKTILSIIIILIYSLTTFAQNRILLKDTSIFHFNPILTAAFKKAHKPNSNLNDRFKSPNNQLMYWPNYPLSAAQIEARGRKNNESIVKQIASDLIYSYVNSLLYGKKHKPATVPEF